MSNPARQPVYSVDSSSLMDWQGRYFPTDVFTGLLAKVEELISAGRFIAPALVKEEVGIVGTPGLVDWAENHAGIFVPTNELLAEAQGIQNQFPATRSPLLRAGRCRRALGMGAVPAAPRPRNPAAIVASTPHPIH